MNFDLITVNFFPAMGSIFIIVFLISNKKLEPYVRKNFFVFALIVLAELVIYNLEMTMMYTWVNVKIHTLMTALGYTLRPFMLCEYINIANRRDKKKTVNRLMLIPAVANVFYAFAPFYGFERLTYWYTDGHVFYRGPLGYFPYISTAVYIVAILYIALQVRKVNWLESLVIFMDVIFLTVGVVSEGFFACYAMLRICVVAVMTYYYMFFQSEIYKEDIFSKKLEQAKMADEFSLELITTLAGTIDAKDAYTKGHSQRVAAYSKEIARRLGKDEGFQKEIYCMGLLHDIGKIGIPDSIINKNGRLSEDEFTVMREHSVIGSNLLKDIKIKPNLFIGARWHHERCDGKGYPDGLRKRNIPIEARIIAVAEVYDAMSSSRSYRSLLPQSRIITQLEASRDTQLDSEIVTVMLQMIYEDPDYKMQQGSENYDLFAQH